MVGKPSRLSESGRETHPEVKKWSGELPESPEVVGDPPEGMELVGTPSRRSGSGRETRSEVRKWSGDPAKGAEVVWRPFPEIRKWS